MSSPFLLQISRTPTFCTVVRQKPVKTPPASKIPTITVAAAY